MSIIYPLCNLLREQYTKDNHQELVKISKEYSIRYMWEKERSQLFSLLDTYKKATNSTKNEICSSVLYDYFIDTLKKKYIEVNIVPVDIDGEIGYGHPFELFHLYDDLKKLLNRCDYSLWDEYEHYFDAPIEEEIEKLYSKYLKLFSSTANILFFDNKTATDVIENSKSYKEWKNHNIKLKNQVDNFLKLGICQKVKKEMEGNNGNQSK